MTETQQDTNISMILTAAKSGYTLSHLIVIGRELHSNNMCKGTGLFEYAKQGYDHLVKLGLIKEGDNK